MLTIPFLKHITPQIHFARIFVGFVLKDLSIGATGKQRPWTSHDESDSQ